MNDELDILKELGNIAAGHGSIALSELLGRKIKLVLPGVSILPAEAILKKFGSELVAVGVTNHVFTGLKSNILFIMDEPSAFSLIDACYKINADDRKSGILTELGVSIVKEVGNVVISAYMGALSIMLKTLIIPSTPTFMSGPFKQILHTIISPYHDEEYILCTEAMLEEPTRPIKCSLFLTLNPKGIKYIQDVCKKNLEAL